MWFFWDWKSQNLLFFHFFITKVYDFVLNLNDNFSEASFEVYYISVSNLESPETTISHRVYSLPFRFFVKKKENKPWDCTKNYSDAPAEWPTTQKVAWPVGEYQIQFYFDIRVFHNSTMFQAGNTHILLLVFVFLCEVHLGFCILDSSKGRKSMVRFTNLCSSFLNLSWFFFIFHFYFLGDLHNVPFRYFVKVFGFFLDLVPCKKNTYVFCLETPIIM